MPVGSNLPQKSVILRYPPTSTNVSNLLNFEREGEESYQLLELPPEIIKAVEAKRSNNEANDKDNFFPLTIKGKPSDDAVLCTPNSTFLLRTVGISNSILVCRTPSSSSSATSSSSTLQIRDTCHEIIECLPISPNLDRIQMILKKSSWKGLGINSSFNLGKRKREEEKVKKWTRDQLNSVIQASDEELEIGLKERNVIEFQGKMLLLPPKELKELLSIILSLLTIHNFGPGKLNLSPSKPIIECLENDHEISNEIIKEVLKLFGELSKKDEEEEIWKANIKKIIKEIGNGLLIGVKDKKLIEFEKEWKEEIGEEWKDEIDIKLLEGEYLISNGPINSITFNSLNDNKFITHFPLSSLPIQPLQRFTDLFLTKSKWNPEEILPFLKGLTCEGDIKSRDKLIVKFVRVVKEKDGIWWYPRRS
ncbi:uncharacterized protein I206_104910 [Kwoniella pini CBS 10737]|uniref:Sister chromatid cohesion protein DCC1 n=1 Tax=Kwoniella pini CBS 10737 TaxID=1296096 RepID=A0A1B9I876_9TREE|nr:uncharacterized protein I206_02450 [Kwoniella pini CBS 10737]OCF51735.1 hypothetical protein I206_02450 [Kwoniella pini CBS 10737]